MQMLPENGYNAAFPIHLPFHRTMFQHSADELCRAAEHALHLARSHGATAAEADLSESVGLDVQVRLQDIDQIEHQQDTSLDITVYIGRRKGRASTSDLSEQALAETVRAAADIARYTAEDPFAGLPETEWMAEEFIDLDKYHEWRLDSTAAVSLAKRCEAAALDYDKRITNSDGASVSHNHFQYVYANSHGFLQHRRGTRHSISCSSVAADGNGNMERDYWYDVACDATDLEDAEHIGRTAAQRSVKRLNPRPLHTGSYPVIFDASVSGSLIGHIIGGLNGNALYRENSFLLNSLGKAILPEFIHLREEPHLPRMLGSTDFDSEGVATQPRFIIENGIVQGYFLNSYSARKLGMQSTGNAGGAHNLHLNATCAAQSDLLRQMGNGLLITELMGQGVNILTGDYSRGAAGFWVENGVITHPVSEITIAGKLQDMLLAIAGTADDALHRHSGSKIGSILIEKMTVAGT